MGEPDNFSGEKDRILRAILDDVIDGKCNQTLPEKYIESLRKFHADTHCSKLAKAWPQLCEVCGCPPFQTSLNRWVTHFTKNITWVRNFLLKVYLGCVYLTLLCIRLATSLTHII